MRLEQLQDTQRNGPRHLEIDSQAGILACPLRSHHRTGLCFPHRHFADQIFRLDTKDGSQRLERSCLRKGSARVDTGTGSGPISVCLPEGVHRRAGPFQRRTGRSLPSGRKAAVQTRFWTLSAQPVASGKCEEEAFIRHFGHVEKTST